MSKKLTSVEKEELYNSFLSRFPLDSLQNMTLEQYTGTEDSRDNFCYWVQYKVDKVGGMKGGSSDIFGIYKHKNPSKKPKMISDSQYSWLRELGSDANAAWEKIRGLICSIAKSANEGRYGDIDSIQCIGNNFKWKVAFLYSNKKIPPIYSKKAVKLLAKKHHINIANSEPQSNIETKLMSLKGDMDFWEFADMLWDECEKSDDWFLKTIASIAKSLKEKMESEKFSYAYNKDDIFARNKKDFFIWVKTDDKIIGDEDCHYEFYFDKKKNKMFPMIHFENNFKKDSDILKRFSDICKHKQLKMFPRSRDSWFYIEDSEMNIGEYEGDRELFCKTAIGKMRELDNRVGNEIKKEINRMRSKDNLEPYVNKLKKVKNLILTGATGTGKTYYAEEIAKAMNAEVKIVQFHPSYDYTDFVEGLRPVEKNGTLGFERRDGVFKEFCALALKNLENSRKSKDVQEKEATVSDLIDEFISNATDDSTKFAITTGNEFYIESSDQKYIFVKVPSNDKRNELTLQKQVLVDLLSAEDKLTNSGKIREFYKRKWRTQEDSYYFALYEKLYEKRNSYKAAEVKQIERKDFVFIIDEINRGEVSKIFGELFYAIDPGYRGKKEKAVQTQYQNLIHDGEAFKDGFYVPENVYIIGTMNDIDRSVESIDFAFRRRFTWTEITAESSLSILDKEAAWESYGAKPSDDEISKLKNRLTNLNKEISSIDGLNSSYHIGGSYLLKYASYKKDEAFEKLWTNHLSGVLFEYLRGRPQIDQIIQELKKAYDTDVIEDDEDEAEE